MRTDTKKAIAMCARLMLWMTALGLVQGLAFKVWRTYHPGWIEPDYAEGLATAVAALFAYAQVLSFELGRSQEHWPQLGQWRIGSLQVAGAFAMLTSGVVILSSEMGNLVASTWMVPEFFVAFYDRLLASPFAALVVAVIVAPVTEELFFRGLILRRLLLTSSPRRAIILSALLFAGMHVNPWQFASTFGMGLAVGWVYHRTRSLLLCMGAHAFNNLIVVCAQQGLMPSIPGFSEPTHGVPVELQPWWLDLLGLFLLAAGAVAFDRLTPRLASRSVPIVSSRLATES